MAVDASSDQPTPGLLVASGPAVEPLTALAMNVHSSPGVYALLLGSGVSFTSGVPTGWGIVTDLVTKVATAQFPDDPEAAAKALCDPEHWWNETFGEPLGYSTLLARTGHSAAARQALLDRYFIPAEGEETTDKAPTAAHRAIARMIKRGAFRVVLTTNFDRLMERALEEVGLPPQVISRPSQLDAMQPLAHARITVIKLHGDYADLTQLNTIDELEQYHEDQQRFLERVLDEHGLVVCGWSADWDKALVRSIEGTRSRRYPMFWSTFGALGTAAQQLVTQHGAGVIHGMSADELFTGLEKRLEALDRMAAPPMSRDMAVVQLKKALPDPVKRIDLFDLVQQHTMQVVDAVAAYPVYGDEAIFAKNVEGMRQGTDTLLHLLAAGVFHDEGAHRELWLKSVERLVHAADASPGSPYSQFLDDLRLYPALLATWTMGVAAVLARREELIAALLTKPLWAAPRSNANPRLPSWYLNPWNVLNTSAVHTICRAENGGKYKYPHSPLLREAVREPLRLVEPDDRAFEAANDRFQMLASLISLDADGPEWSREPWPGDYLLDSRWGYGDNGPAAALQREIGPDWPLLRAGAFGGDPARAKAAFTALNEWRSKNRQW